MSDLPTSIDTDTATRSDLGEKDSSGDFGRKLGLEPKGSPGVDDLARRDPETTQEPGSHGEDLDSWDEPGGLQEVIRNVHSTHRPDLPPGTVLLRGPAYSPTEVRYD